MFVIDHGLSPTAPAELAPAGRLHGSKRSRAEVVVRGLELSDLDFVASILEQLGWQSRSHGFSPRGRSCLRAGCRRLEWFAFESNRAVAALARDLLDCRSTRVGGGVVRSSAATSDSSDAGAPYPRTAGPVESPTSCPCDNEGRSGSAAVSRPDGGWALRLSENLTPGSRCRPIRRFGSRQATG